MVYRVTVLSMALLGCGTQELVPTARDSGLALQATPTELYGFYASGPGSFVVAIAGQQRAALTANGARLWRGTGPAGHSLSVRLAGYGRGAHWQVPHAAVPVLGTCAPGQPLAADCVQRVEYAYDGTLREWWVAHDAGLQQEGPDAPISIHTAGSIRAHYFDT